MSSPMTFSGFNDIDRSVVLNALMQQASVPLNSLQSRRTALASMVYARRAARRHIQTPHPGPINEVRKNLEALRDAWHQMAAAKAVPESAA